MTPDRTFEDYLADSLQLNATDTAGLLRVCEVLDNLKDDRPFWQGLRAWVNRLGDNLAEKDAAARGEPTGFVLGRRMELRCLPGTLRETLEAVGAEHKRWLPPPEPTLTDDGY